MRAGSQSQGENCRRQLFLGVVLGCLFGSFVAEVSVADSSNPAIRPVAKKTIVEGISQLSPPALQFDETGALHVAWFEKNGDDSTLKTVRVSDSGRAVGEPVRVNPVGVEPDALHQAPGLATDKDNQLFITWSSAKKTAMPCSPLTCGWRDRPTEVGPSLHQWW